MIDGWSIVANSLWILGLAVLLAGCSWASWIAGTNRRRFGVVLRQPGIQRTLNLGLMLFCMGLASTARAWWERILWGLLAAAFAVQAWVAKRGMKTMGGYDNDE